jgi:hypothetical protein
LRLVGRRQVTSQVQRIEGTIKGLQPLCQQLESFNIKDLRISAGTAAAAAADKDCQLATRHNRAPAHWR